MNIFTTVMSGGVEQLFQLIGKDKKVLLLTDKNVVSLDKVQSLLTMLDEKKVDYVLVDSLPAESTNNDVLTLLSNLPSEVDQVLGYRGQLKPDTRLGRFSAIAGGTPSLC